MKQYRSTPPICHRKMLTRHGKFEAIYHVDSVRKIWRDGWLGTEKLEGMVDSARKNHNTWYSILNIMRINPINKKIFTVCLYCNTYILCGWWRLKKWSKMQILIASSISTFNLLFHSKMTDDLIQISLFLELTILL